MNREEYNAIKDRLEEALDPDILQFLADQARLIGVLDAVVLHGDAVDVRAVAAIAYKEKSGLFPFEMVLDIVKEYIPRLEQEGLIIDKKPTPKAIQLSQEHLAMLAQDEQRH